MWELYEDKNQEDMASGPGSVWYKLAGLWRCDIPILSFNFLVCKMWELDLMNSFCTSSMTSRDSKSNVLSRRAPQHTKWRYLNMAKGYVTLPNIFSY